MNDDFQINERIREIREYLNLGRKEFERNTGIKRETIQAIELKRQLANSTHLSGICKKWPRFSVWLLTGETDPSNGQTSPEEEKARQDLGTDEKAA